MAFVHSRPPPRVAPDRPQDGALTQAPSTPRSTSLTTIARAITQGFVLAAPVALLFVCALARRWMDDDGFINLRVVRNLLAGEGPVYNVGERVEVFTSSLWIGILTILGAAGIQLEYAAVFGGIALSCLGLGLAVHASMRADRAWSRDSSSGLHWPLGAAMVAILPPNWDYASSGLETGLTFAWLGGSYVLTVVAIDAPASRKATLAAAFVGLGPLVRPELALYTLSFLLPLASEALGGHARGLQQGHRAWRRPVVLLACAAAAPVAYELFRMAYFAALTPNTAIAKEAFRTNVKQGLCYWKNFFHLYAVYLPLGVIGLFAVVRLVGTIASRRGLLLAPVVAAALHAAYIVRVGGDYMHGRMFLPVVFAVAMPFATVRLARPERSAPTSIALAVATLPFAAWLVVCGTRLRVDRENVCGIGDERGWYARIAEVPRPVLLSDYTHHTFYRVGTTLDTGLSRACASTFGAAPKDPCRRLFLDEDSRGVLLPRRTSYPLSGDLSPRVEGAAVASAIGIAGYLLPSSVHLVDRLGLADPLGARMELGERGRPGHEKAIGNAWVVARFAEPERIDDASVTAARHALSCGPLAELAQATRDPLTIGRALRNLVASFRLQSLRVPRDPFTAEERFCRTPPPPRSPQVGGSGGKAYAWRCPLGMRVGVISGSVAVGAGAIASLSATCLPREGADLPLTGPPFGGSEKELFDASCRDTGGIVGLRGNAGRVVNRLRAVCADGTETSMVGEGDDPGDSFETTCPEGTLAIGVAGRAGALIDAVGLICGPDDRR